MFAAPPEMTATEFTRVPDEFRIKGRRPEWAVRRGRGEVHSFLEGPCFDAEGNLWVTDIPYGRIFRISPQGKWTLACEYDGWPNGLRFRRDGAVFITDQKNGIVELDPKRGTTRVVLGKLPDGRPLHGPNDLWFTKNGDLYFTDQGDTGLQDPTGRLVRIRADGNVDVILQNIPSPNGLVVNRSEHHVLVAVTRANCVWRVPVPQPGEPVGKTGVFVQMSGGFSGGPDSMTIDEEDTLVVAHVGLGSAWLFNRIGEPVLRIRSCAGLLVTNAAYGGPERKDLYITESEQGVIMHAKMQVPGRTSFSD